MNFKKYLKNIEKKFVEQKPTRKIEPKDKTTKEKINHEEKKIPNFIDKNTKTGLTVITLTLQYMMLLDYLQQIMLK